ncbi:MAG: hypothetical protein KF797_09225, partial [Flavobacteriales bacterium]|nr:hypothetical protein [Flavobacteriales bacterium]
ELRRKRMSVLLAGWDLAERQGDRAEMKSWWRAVARERDNGWGRLTTVRNWMKAWMPGIERLLGR